MIPIYAFHAVPNLKKTEHKATVIGSWIIRGSVVQKITLAKVLEQLVAVMKTTLWNTMGIRQNQCQLVANIFLSLAIASQKDWKEISHSEKPA